MADLQLQSEVEYDPTWPVFVREQLERDLRFGQRRQWHVREKWLPGDHDGDVLSRLRWGKSETVVLQRDGCVLHVELRTGEATVAVAAPTERLALEQLKWLRELLPEAEPTEDSTVPVSFWVYGPNGPQQVSRDITVPGWDDVRGNYASGAQAELEQLFNGGFRPATGGQLMLWQGLPGTGKTYALRALAWEWRDWAEVHYVVDPDKFFGAHADYMLGVLLQDSSRLSGTLAQHHGVGGAPSDEDEAEETELDFKWKVLLLEDTGELLSADAKERTGQALSRLLNVVDGIIGQGLQILVLVTTNEELKTLHPAVQRPGRCASRIEFGPLPLEEANEWLARHGVDADVSGSRTLADLYALAGGYARDERQLVGFA